MSIYAYIWAELLLSLGLNFQVHILGYDTTTYDLVYNKIMTETNLNNLQPGEIPSELTYVPVPFIALLGLNATHNEIHAHIWNLFTVNRQIDRPPLYFKLLNDNHQFLIPKPKKSSYEWHIPKGILKTNWLSKHLFEIPSVCVLFVDLDWDDQLWSEKQTECVKKVEYLKHSLKGRDTKIIVVLLQKSISLPADDTLATERATLLCNSCDLSPNFLFVLPVNDLQQLIGYILRLESAIFELSKSYYQHEIKLIKSHREQLNKTTHQFLFVRHQFKVAFFSEIRQDQPIALKHYKQAYANLMEVRVTLINLHEIKTIGGFINYKICKLSFCLNSPLDAISQFRKHIDIFKNKNEPTELEFEHSAWLSKQYSLFGDLFDNAIMSGLVPSSLQHPGFYYYEAALQAIHRKKLCMTVCNDPALFDSSFYELYNSILTPSKSMEFFGQRAWRPGCQTLEPIDVEKEKLGIKALQHREAVTINYPNLIISLLSAAINQFKKFKCLRMKQYLMVLVGEEYYVNRDYSNALNFLTNVLSGYRKDVWNVLVEYILSMAFYAAYLSADLINFVKLGLEFISLSVNKSIEEKKLIHTCIENVLSGLLPLKLENLLEEEMNYCMKQWEVYFNTPKENVAFTIRMDSILPFIQCKVSFKNCIDEKVNLEVEFKSNCPLDMKFSKLNVLFSNNYYNQFCEKSAISQDEIIVLNYMKWYKTNLTFSLLEEDIKNELAILGVSLTQTYSPHPTSHPTSHPTPHPTPHSTSYSTCTIVLQWTFFDKEIILNSSKDLSLANLIVKNTIEDNLISQVSEKKDVIKNETDSVTSIKTESQELFVEMKIPDICKARNPTLISYIIHNCSDQELPVELSMGSCDNFMFSGNKSIQTVIFPKNKFVQNYIFYPLICGSILLPTYRIVIFPDTHKAKVIDYFDDLLPKSIFVMPQDKIKDPNEDT